MSTIKLVLRLLVAIALLTTGFASAETRSKIWPTSGRLTRETTITTFPNYYETTESETLRLTITKSSVITEPTTEIYAPLITVTAVHVVDYTDTQTVHLPAQTLRVARTTKTTSLRGYSSVVPQTSVQPSVYLAPTTVSKSITAFHAEIEYLTQKPTILQTRVKPTQTEATVYATVTKTEVSKLYYTRTSTEGLPFTSVSADITVSVTNTAVTAETETKNITITSTVTLVRPVTSCTIINVTRTVTQFVAQTDYYPVNVTVTDWIVDTNGLVPEYSTTVVTPSLTTNQFRTEDTIVSTTFTATDTQVKAETSQTTVAMIVTQTAVAVATTTETATEAQTVVVTATYADHQ